MGNLTGNLAANLNLNAKNHIAEYVYRKRPSGNTNRQKTFDYFAYSLTRNLFLKESTNPLLIDKTFPNQVNIIFDLHKKTGREFAYSYIYEPQTVHFIEKFYKPGTIAIDIGSHVGYFSVFMGNLAKKSSGKVLSYEPVTENFSLLRRNIILNKLENVVTPQNLALSNINGTSNFSINPLNDGGGMIGNSKLVADGDRYYTTSELNRMGLSIYNISVKTQKLDDNLSSKPIHDFLKTTSEISIIKCDVEGGELDVLKGGLSTLSQGNSSMKPIWIIEVSSNISEIFRLMSDAEYSGYYMSQEKLLETNLSNLIPGSNILFK